MRVLIADDESVARKRLLRLLGAMPGVEVVGECASGEEVLQRVAADAPDVLLLDVQMPGLTGIEAKALLPEGGPYVIFATAHPEHAVDAFDVGAVDYLLKPIEAPRLARALDRARKFLEARAPKAAGGDALARLPIATRKGIVLVDPADVSHAIFDGSLVSVHTRGGVLLTDTSLQELGERLPPETFERVHRRAILNLQMVERLEPLETGGYVAKTVLGEAVQVSRQAARKLRRRLGLARGTEEADGDEEG